MTATILPDVRGTARSRISPARRVRSVMFQVGAIILGLLLISPVIYAILISFTKADQILSLPPQYLPREPTFENYQKALEYTSVGRYMLNSFIISAGSSISRIITAALAAFAFSFFNFRGKKFLFMVFLGTIMIPIEVVLVTNYQTASDFGLVNTYLGMMLIFLVSALNIFLMRQYFLSFPTELREASQLDGCSNFRFFLTILLPSSMPIMVTIFISAFLSTWNTYLWPLMTTNKDSLRTVQAGITMLNFPDGSAYGPIMAASVMVLIPCVLVFIIFQRRIMAGMMAGAVKG